MRSEAILFGIITGSGIIGSAEEEITEEEVIKEEKQPEKEDDIEQLAINAEIERSNKIGQFEQRLAKKRAERAEKKKEKAK